MFTPFDKTHVHNALHAPLLLGVVLLVIVLLAASGCRTARDNQFDILERELRTQEDYIYELEDYVVEYSQKLRKCRCLQPTSAVKNSYESNSVVKKSKPAELERLRIEPLQIDEEPLHELEKSPAVEPAIETENSIPDVFDIPELEIGDPLGQIESTSTPELANYDQSYQPVTAEEQVLQIPNPVIEMEPLREPVVHDQQVVTADHQLETWDTPARTADRIVIARLFRNEVSENPPKTLLAVVETLDTNDEPVEFSGEVSLMVMTGGSRQPQRLKRWDFKPDDAASAWQSSHLGDGLHLELPLGETVFPEVPLELWVRIVGQEGRKLLAQLPFDQERLATLEMETDAAEGQLLVAEEAQSDEQAKQPSGWKSASHWTEIDSLDQVSTIKKTNGWIPQPTGGRFPQVPSTTASQSTSNGGNKPVWMAGRVNRTPPPTVSRHSRPRWSPRR